MPNLSAIAKFSKIRIAIEKDIPHS